MRKERQEDNFQRLNLESLGQPSRHSPEHFKVDEYNKTKRNEKADLIRRGDFKNLVRANNGRRF